MQDDNLRSNMKDYTADYTPAAGNVIPGQTFAANEVELSEPAAAEDMLRRVTVETDNDESYEKDAAAARQTLFGRSIVQVFAISAILVTLVIGVLAAGVLTVKKQSDQPQDSSKVIASVKSSPSNSPLLSTLQNSSISINRDTLLAKGSTFTTTGDVLVQSQVNSANAFKIQNAAGNNLLVADTLKGTVSVNGSLVTTGPLKVGDDIAGSGFELSGQGLTIGGVLVCTSAGCKPSVPIPDTSSFARLAANNTFTGVNKFTSGGNVFAGDGSGLSALNAGNITSGTLSDSRLSGNVAFKNSSNTFSGNNTFNQLLQAAGGVNATAYSVNGTAGASLACGPTELIQNGTVQGGIITSGTCITPAGVTPPTFQEVYNNSNPATFVLNSTNGALNIQDAATPIGVNLFTVQSNGGGTTYFAVSSNGIDISGNVNTNGQYQVNGSQISSSNLSDGANLAKLNGNQTFTGTNSFTNAGNSFTGDGTGLTNVNAAQLNGQAGSYYTNASNISTGTLNDARLSNNVTQQGNTFNGANELVQLTAGGILPVLNGSNLTALNASSVSSGTLSDARLSANVALLNANNIFLGNNSFKLNTTAFSVQDAATPLGADLFTVTDDSGATKYFSVSATGAKVNGDDVCTTSGNCVGVSGGAIGGSGTVNQIALFTGTGFTIGDSILSQSAGTITAAGNVNVTGQFQVGGSQISSTNLSNDANLAKLNGNQTFTANNTFNNSITAPGVTAGGAALGIGASNDTLNLNGNYSSNLVVTDGTNSTTVGFSGVPVGNVIYSFDAAAAAGTYTICTTAGNCVGGGGGVTTSSNGTSGTIAMFTGAQTIANSIITQSGTTVTVAGTLDASSLTQSGTAVLLQSTAFSGDVSGAYNSLSVDKIKGTSLSIATLADTNFLIYNSTSGNWENHSFSGDITVSNTGAATIGTGAVTSLKIADGTIDNADISATAAITDTKLAQITTANKVADSALSSNVALLDRNGQTFSGTNSFSNSITAPGVTAGGAALGIGASGDTLNLNGNFSSRLAVTDGSHTTTVGFAGTAVGNVVYDFDVAAATGTYNICTSAGNCVGVSGGAIGGSGTANKLAKFTGSGFTIGDSILTDNGTTVSVAGTLNATTLQQGGNGVLLQTTAFTGDVSGAYNTLSVDKLKGTALSITSLADTNFLIYNSTSGNWENHSFSGDITVANTGAATIGTGAVNSLKIADGTIANVDISATAAIADTKLAQITSANKVADSALSSNVALLNRAGQTFTGTNSFSSSITTPGITAGGAALGIGASGDTLNLNGTYSSDWSVTNGTNSTTIGFSGVPTANVVYNFDVAAALGTYTICTTAGNCVGVSGGAIGGSGTANKLAKFTGSGFTIGDSILTDNGTTVSVAGTLNATTLQQGGTGVLLQTTAFSGDVSGVYNATSVDKLKGTALSIATLANTNFLIYNSTSGNWENHSLSGDLTVTNAGAATIGTGAVSSLKIADGTIANVDISATAAIAYSKLNLNASIVDADVAASSHFAFTNANQTFTANNTFNNNITAPGITAGGAALGIGASNDTLNLNGNYSSSFVVTNGTNSTTVGFVGVPTANVVYDFDVAAAAGTYNICTSAGNCVGVSGGAIGGSGTANKLAKFTGSGFTIGDSILTDNGTTVSVAGTLNATTLQQGGTGVLLQTTAFSGDVSGAYNATSVDKLKGTALSINTLADTNFLVYNSTSGNWENHSFSGDLTVTNAGAATIANSAVTSLKIADGTIANVDIAAGAAIAYSKLNLNASIVDADVAASSHFAFTNANQTFTANNTFNNSITAPGVTAGGAALGIGASNDTLNLNGNYSSSFVVTNGTNSTTVGFSGIPATNVVYDFDVAAAAGTYTVCTTAGNCVGVSGGAIGGSGTANKLAKFTGSGFTIGDSILTDNGTTVSVAGTINATTLQQGGTGVLLQTTAFSGDVSGAYNATSVDKLKGTPLSIATLADTNFLIYNSTSGNWENHSFSGDLSVTNAGAATIANGAVTSLKIADGTIANVDIAAGAAIDYSKLNLSGSIVNSDISGSAAIAYSKLNLGSSIVSGDLSASLASSLAFLANNQTFTGLNTFKNNNAAGFQVQNSTTNKTVMSVDTSANKLVLGTSGPSGLDGTIVFNNSAGTNTVGISLGANPSASYTLLLPTTGPGTGQCLQTDGTVANQLVFGGCAGSGSGVTTVGTYSSTNHYADGANITGTTITLGSADATHPGLVDSSSQTFAGDKTFSTNTATGFQVQNSASSKNVLAVDTSSNIVTVGTSGASGITGDLKFNFSGSTGSISLVPLDPSAANYTLNLPAENGTICTTAASAACTSVFGSGSGSTTTLAQAYANGTNATAQTLLLASGNGGGLVLKDAATTVGNLFTVQNSTATTNYLNVTSTTVAITDNLTVSGTINTNTFDNAGNLTFGNSGAANINSASGQTLNLGTASNAHTTVLGSTTGASTTTVQGGSGGIGLNGNTTVGAGNSLSFAAGSGSFDAHNATGTFQTSTGANTLNGNVTISGSNTFTTGTGNVLLQGATDVSATTSFATKAGATFTTAGISNNAALNVASLYLMDTSGIAQVINGITAGRDGQHLTLVNVDPSLPVTLSNNSASATGSKIITGTAADVTLASGASIDLIYDSANSLWRVVGGVAGGSGTCPTCANQQLSNLSGTVAINLSLNPNADNSLDLGSAANSWRTVYADTSLLTPAVDVATAGTLAIGNTTATGVSICNSAACDTVSIGTNADADTINIGDSLDTLTVTGGSSSTFVINGSTISAAEFVLLDGHDVALVDTNDAVNTAITGTGALNSGSITSGFGSIDTGADNITTTGTIQGNTIDRSTSGTLNVGTTNATSISLDANTTISGSKTFTTGTGNVLLQGATDVSASTSFATRRNATTFTTAGTTVDAALNASSLYILDTSGAAQTIDSIVAGRDGQHLTLVNADASLAVTIRDASTATTATAANKISTGTGANVTLAAGASVDLIYDTSANLWRVVGGVAGGAGTCPTCANQQLSNLSGTVAVNLALNPNADNSLDLGSAATSWRTVYADTSLLTPAVDVATAGALALGNNTATSVSICNSAACDTVSIGTNADADTINIGDSLDTLTVTGGASSTFVINGSTISAAEFVLLDGHDVALVDTNDAVNTAITGTGALNSGSITSGFGSIDTGADNITTTGTVQGNTIDRSTSGTLNVGTTNATSISLDANTTISGSKTFTTGTGNVLLQGATDVSASTSFATRRNTTAFTTPGTTVDAALNTSSLYILDTSGAAQTIDSIVAGRDGQHLTLVNADTSLAVTIRDTSTATTATAVNKISTGTGANVTLSAGASIDLIYDTSANLWRVVGSVAGGAGTCPTCANQQLSNLSGTVAVNLSLNPNADNSLDLGSAANSWRTVYADTSLLTPAVDVATAGALAIGNTTATSVSICNSAACDTVSIGTNADADTINIGDSLDTLTVTGGASSTFVINGSTISAAEFVLLDGHDVALVDTNDAVNTAITGTGALNSGSITSGFGSIDTGADNITTTGTVQGNTIDRSTSGTLNVGTTNATSISLDANTTISGSKTFTTGTGNVLLQGATDVSASTSFATRRNATTFTTPGTTVDAALNTSSLYILDTSGAAQAIDSIVAGRDGQHLTLVNADTTNSVTIRDASTATTVTAANKISTGTGANVTLAAGASIDLIYDTSASLWRVVGGVAGGSGTCPTCANQQLSNLSGTVAVNLSLNPNADNSLDLGSAANSWRTVYADTSLLTPAVDVASAGALGIGNTTATSVSICNSAACDSISIGTNADADTINIGDGLDTLTVSGSSSSSFVINGSTISAAEFVLLDGHDVALVDTNDAVNTAITGTGALNSGSITSGFGSIDTGTDNITTTGTVQGNTIDRSTSGTLNVGTTNATSISLDANTTISGSKTFTSGTGTVLLQGATDVSASTSFATRRNTTTFTAPGTTVDAALNTSSLYILDTSGSAQTIDSIVAGRDGQHLTLVNADASLAVTIRDVSTATTVTAANKISTGTGANITLPAGASIDLIYDTSASLWRVVGGVAGGAGTCPTCANQQLSNLSGTVAVNLALNPNADNSLDLGSAANSWRTVYADTSVLTPAVDVATAGALSIGNTTATSVSICNSAACDTISIGTNADADTIQIGDGLDTLTVSGSSSSSFVINGSTISAAEFVLLDGHDVALVDTNDAVSTAITGTGALNAGSITSGFGAIDTGADNITTTGTVQGNTIDRSTSGTLNIGTTNATSISLDSNVTISGSKTFTSGTGTVLLQGATDVSASTSFATRRNTTTFTAPGTTVDAALNASSLYILDTSGAAQTIDSIVAGRDGQHLTLVNADTSLAVTIRDASTATTLTAANKISTGMGANVTLPAGSSIDLIYDTSASLWRVIGGVAGGSGTCPTCANQQLSNLSGTVAVNLSLNPNADNSLDLGSAANSWRTVYADTSVLTPALDVASAGALAIGNATATSVSICNSAACDSISIGTNADADTINIGDSLDTISISGTTTVNGTINTNTFNSNTLTFGNNAAAASVDAGGGQTLNLGTSATAHNTFLGSTGGGSQTTINAGTGGIILGSSTIQRSASSLTLDVNAAATSTLTVTNSNASNIANLSVEGGVTIGASGVYAVGGSTGSSTTCSGGNVLQNAVVTGGIITGGSCVANGGGATTDLQTAYNNTASSPATITTTSAAKTLLFKAGATFDSASLFQVQNAAGNQVFTVDSSANQVVLGRSNGASGLNGKLTFANSANNNTFSFVSGATGASLVYTLPTSDATSGSVACLQTTGGTGVLAFGDCSGTGGGGAGNANRQLSNLSGVAVNASLTPGTNGVAGAGIDLGDSTHVWRNLYLGGSISTASLTDLLLQPTTGIAKLNTASQANELQIYESAPSPTSYTSIKNGSIGTTSGNLTLNAAGGTIILGANTTTLQKSGTAFSFDLNNASNSTFTLTNGGAGIASLSVEGGVSIGSSQTYNVGAATGQTISCSGAQVLTGSAFTGGVLTTAGSCSSNGSTPDLQTVYGASSDSNTTPQLTLNTTKHGLIIQDASTPLGSILFAVQSNGGANKYISVTSNGVDVFGNITATGTYNTNQFTSSQLTFGGAGAASVDANGSQNLNVGTANNGHTTTVGSSNASSTTTIQGGSVINLVGSVNVNGSNTFTSGTGTVTLQGATDVSATTSFATKRGTTYTTPGPTAAVDAALSTASLYVLDTSGAAQIIDSIVAGRDGQQLTLINGDASLAVTIRDQSTATTATAANKIVTGTGGNINLAAGSSISLIYDTSASRWRVIGDVAGGTGSGVTTVGPYTTGATCANGATISSNTITLCSANTTNPGLVDSGAQTFNGAKTFAALITGNAGITTSGGAVTLQGNAASQLTTSTGNLTLDATAASASVNIGTGAQAKTIQIGINGTNTGNTQTINIGNQAAAGTTNVVIGSTTGATGGTTTIQSVGVLNLGNSVSSSIAIQTASSGTINIGTVNASAVSIGNTSSSFNAEASGTANLFNGNTGHTINIGAGASTTAQAITIGSATATVASTVTVQGGNGAGAISLQAASGGTILIGTTNGNSVGIGTTGPDRRLDVLDATNPQLRLTQADGTIFTDFQTTSSGYLNILASGSRVGIGNSNPTTALDVNGDISVGAGNMIRSTSGNLLFKSGNTTYATLNATSTRVDFAQNVNVQPAVSSTAFQVNNATKSVFAVDTSSNVAVLGNSGASGVTGQLKFNFSGSTGSTTLTVANPGTNNFTATIPTLTANANICTDNAVCSGYAPSSGSTNYLSKTSTDTASANAGSGYLYSFTNSGAAGTGGVLNLQNGTNTGTILNLKGTSSTAFVVQNASNNSLVLDTNTTQSHLKVYDGSATQSYVDISYSDASSSAVISSSSGDLTLQAGAGGTVKVGSGSGPVNITTSAGANINLTPDGGTNTGVVLKPTNNTTKALLIQSASAADTLFTADTTNNRITIGNATGTGAATTVLVLDSAAGVNPTGVAGAMYYDSTANQFKCFTTSWGNCAGAGSTPTLATTYANGTTATDQTILLSSADGGGIVIKDNATSVGSALQIQNSSGTALLNADTQNMKIAVTGDVNVGSRFGNRLFSDNFESGGFGLWTGTLSGSTLSVSNAVTHNGSYAARMNETGTIGAISTKIASTATAYVRLSLYSASHTTDYSIARIIDTNSSAISSLFYRQSDGKLCVFNAITSTTAGCTASAISDSAWHTVELKVTVATSTTGVLQLVVDGTQAFNITNSNNGTTNIGNFGLGEDNLSRTATWYADDLSIDTVSNGTASSLNVDDSLHVGGTSTFGNSVLVQATSDSTKAFQVQNAAGNNAVLDVDTANLRIGINTSAPAAALHVVGPRQSIGSFDYNAQFFDSGATAQGVGGGVGFGGVIDGSGNTKTFGAIQGFKENSTSGNYAGGLKFFTRQNGVSSMSQVLTLSSQGAATFENSVDSTAAFQIQNQNGASGVLLNADTSNMRISIGSNGTATGQLYVAGSLPTAAAGSVATGTNPNFVKVVGRYAYVANNGAGSFNIIDVSNPAAPSVISTTTACATTGGIAVQGNYAYVSCNGTGFQVYNISNPNSPSLAGSTTIGSGGHQLYVQGRYAYVPTAAGVDIIDISNPANPTKVGSWADGSVQVYGLYVSGHYAYASLGDGTVHILDVSNPASPTALNGAGITVSAGQIHHVVVVGRYMYVVDRTNSRFSIYDVSNPTVSGAVSAVGSSTASLSTPESFYIQGRYAYITNFGNSTMAVYDISNPASPVTVGTITTNTGPWGNYVSGRYLYVVDNTASVLQVFDLGGEYAQQFEAGGAELGTLSVDNNSMFAGDVNIQGGTTIGQSLNVGGSLGVSGGGAFTNSGEITAWQPSTVLTGARTGGTTVTANGYIYMIGGSTTGVAAGAVNTVLYAPLNADGSIGSWNTTSAMPTALMFHTSAYANGYIYVMDGDNTSGVKQTAVYYARVNADGTLGSWSTNANPMPAAVHEAGATVANGYIYQIAGSNGASINTVYYAKLNADGSTGSWTTSTATGLTARTNTAVATSNGYMYVFGGDATSSVQYTSVNANGSLANWSAGTSLPGNEGSFNAYTTNGYVYLVGGHDGVSAPSSAVIYNNLNSDGTLGATWQTSSNPLPATRYNYGGALNNGYLYVLGGTSPGGSTATYYASTARLSVGTSLDLVGLANGTLNGSGGSLTAGDILGVGDLQIQGSASFAQGVSIGGVLSVTSAGTGTTVLSITNTSNGSNILQVQDISQTFGGAATSGAFISNMSYLGEEFNADAQSTASTTNVAIGDDNRSNFRSTSPTTAQYQTPRVVNGVGRFLYGTTSIVGSMYSYGTATTNGTAIDATLKTSNLPLMQTKFIPVQSGNALTINTDYFIGMMDTTTPPTTNNQLPANGVLLWTNNSIPASGGTLSLQGIVRSGSATVGTPVTCSGAYTFGNSIVARIIVTDTTHADFQIDFNAGDGVNFTDCGVVTGTFPTALLSPEFIGIHNETTARQFDIDYVRTWQDDNTTDTSSTDTSSQPADAAEADTTPPITEDGAATVADQIGIIDFTTATSEDTVINGNLFVHGTIYADKIKANEIEGLSIFTDQLASLQQKLAEATNTTTNPNGTTDSTTIIQTATTTLNLSDGLTVGGDASFHGNVFFYKLVTFTEKTLFNNDVTFAAHITTDGAAPTTSLESAAGDANGTVNQAKVTLDGNDNSGSLNITAGDNAASGKVVSVTFAKPYAKAPRVILSAGNDQAASAKYYVQSTAAGFTVYVIDPLASGANLQFNYFVIQ